MVLLGTTLDAFASDPALDARNYPGPSWSPYLVGAGIGILSWLTFYVSDKPIGASSFYATVAGFIGKTIAPTSHGRSGRILSRIRRSSIGSLFLSLLQSGGVRCGADGAGFVNEWVPAMWWPSLGTACFWASFAFGGGVLMAFGARMAGGCTSGHGISGTLQLNVASWIAVVCFFIGGAVIANLMFRT